MKFQNAKSSPRGIQFCSSNLGSPCRVSFINLSIVRGFIQFDILYTCSCGDCIISIIILYSTVNWVASLIETLESMLMIQANSKLYLQRLLARDFGWCSTVVVVILVIIVVIDRILFHKVGQIWQLKIKLINSRPLE